MVSTALITGVAGFIGSHLAESLVNKGLKVIGLKRKSSELWRLKNFQDKLILYDVDEMALESILDRHKIEAFFHLATHYKKNHRHEDIAPMVESNLSFPLKLLDLAASRGGELFINTGTFFEYAHNSLPLKENGQEYPWNLYAASKLAFEKFLEYYSRSSPLKIATLKIFYPYGPRDRENRLVPHMILKALKKEELQLSEGFQKMDFIHVKDIALAYELLLEKADSLEKYQIFNIGSGFPYSIREIHQALSEILGRPIPVRWGEKSTDIPISFADIQRAEKILQWKPQRDLLTGLKETVEFYENEYASMRFAKDTYERR